MNRLISIIIAILLSAAAFAQSVPQTVNFSATVRDANNELLANTAVNVRLTFYEGGENGTPVYCALHQTTTNANGFMSFQLNRNVLAYACNGAPNTPFEEIPWENGNYWMHVEYQAQIAGDFIDLGYLELTSGFYAFSANYALIAQKLEGFDIDVANAQDGDILVYNGTTRKWEARRPENIGGGDTPQPGNYTEGTFEWVREGGAAATGLDIFGLEYRNQTKVVYANIKPVEGARLYILNAADYAITDINTLNARLTSETEATVYRGVSVEASATYNDVLATVYNGRTYLIHVTNSTIEVSEYDGYRIITITGTYKMWESAGTASATYSEPTGYTNGYGYVDLGLPSGTRWATCNVGASTPTAYGDYFAWGETTPKETYNWSTYRYCNGDYNTLTKYCNNSSYGNNGFTDNLTTLEASDDAATANWGAVWRMPTQTEMQELIDNCTVTWTTQNGVNGRLFTGPNGNSIFLPAAGHRYYSELYHDGSYGIYWSSSLYSDNTDDAWYLVFDSGVYGMGYDYRYYGLTVRAVCQSQN